MKTIKWIFLSLFCCVYLVLNAQDIGKINLGVIVPEQMEGLDASQISKLKTKIEQICVKNGISSGFTSNGFVIYPVFEFYQDEVIEGGMQKIYAVKMDLTLFIKQINGVSVGSVSKSYKGAGNSKNKAIVSAIANISTSDIVYTNFIWESKAKILEYYENQCDRIIATAMSMQQQEHYAAAIALLLSVPEESPCYSSILDLTTNVYNSILDKQCNEILRDLKIAKYSQNYNDAISLLYQLNPNSSCYAELEALLQEITNSQCNQILASAKAMAANQQYGKAAQLLATLNPNANCYTEAKLFVAELETKVDKQEQRDWDFKMQQYKDAVKLQQSTIEAAKEVAKAYYGKQPEIHYTQVFSR